MAQVMRHRGPDDDGFFSQGDLHLGFRRLSIIDLDTGHQPLGNEDGSVQVILNGEIYNFRELRQDLEARHRFATRSDTEVIAHLYEERGLDCFQSLNGMFGIAILDVRRQRLVLARDRAGVKPLYYAQCGSDFVFASEIKSLLEHPECPRAVDSTAMAAYLGIQYAPGPRTLFAGIHSLHPGHRLVLEPGADPRIEPYWTLPELDPDTEFQDRAACVRELKALVSDAVRMRLVSDVPLGALLSGGLDSGIVVGLMASMASGPVTTISVGFHDPGAKDETSLAAETARHFGTDHHEIRFGTDDALRLLPSLVWHNDVPIAEALLVPSYMLFHEARRHVTVALSGEGADELFGGYVRYRLLSELRRLRPFLPPASWSGWSRLRAGPGLQHVLGKVGAAASTRVPAEALWEWNCLWSERELEQVLVDPALAARANASAYWTRDGFRTDMPSSELANQLMGIESTNRLVDFILARADKMSMANSLELRTPFLDYRLIEFARRVPSAWKVGLRSDKRILREAFADFLPERLRRRAKHAFQSPYRRWLPPMVEKLFPESRLAQDGLLRHEALRETAARSEHSDRATKRLWSLLMLEMWYRLFIRREEIPAFVGSAAPSVTRPRAVADGGHEVIRQAAAGIGGIVSSSNLPGSGG
jgi:asparagine synthase (glutamine-hydrolysing)